MTANYNEIYIEQRYWEDNFKAGDKFYVEDSSSYSRLKPFIGLEIKSVCYMLGIVCIIFDWNEWENNSKLVDFNKTVHHSINNPIQI